MNSKERFLNTINRKAVDRPPLYVSVTPQVARKLSEHMNIPYEEPLDSMLSTRASHMDLLVKMGVDAVGIATCSPANNPTISMDDGLLKNEWGMIFKTKGQYNELFEFPLADASLESDIQNYNFPEPSATGRWDAAIHTINRYGMSHGVIADLETTLFETAWYLTGLDKFLVDLLLQPEYLNPLLDKLQQIHMNTVKK